MEVRQSLSRRDLFKGMGLVGATAVFGAALSGCASQEEDGSATTLATTADVEWAREADIVVLGMGAAGLAAAITASREGAETLVLEKSNEEDSGGNSRVSGNIWCVATDEAAGLEYALNCANRIADQDTVEYLTAFMKAGMTLNDDFLIDFDMDIVELPGVYAPEHPGVPHSDGCSIVYCANGTVGESALWNALRVGLDECENVEVLYEAPGERLITDADGAVIGVVANVEGAEVNIKARKGVILCTGGYEFNQAMIENTYPAWPLFGRGTPYNTGDGIKMAQKVGADLWHMNCTQMGVGQIKVPGLDFGNGAYDSDAITTAAHFTVTEPTEGRLSLIHVDKHGKRFIAEDRPDRHSFGRREYLGWYDGIECEWPNLPFWIITDAATGEAGPLGTACNNESSKFSWFNAHSGYEWSEDNAPEVERGWVLKANTLAELAAMMEIEAAELEATVERYNAMAAAGVDEDFGRAAELMAPLGAGPYYALQVFPAIYNTQGGPKRNTKAQTLDPFGEPIPGLYNCGECGAGFGWVYNGGWNMAECCITGMWAAADAAARDAWDA